LGIDPAELSGGEIVGSCFAQEAPYKADASHARSTGHASPLVKVFPDGMHDVTFINCNLDNCIIEGVNVVVGERSNNRKIRVMNDGDDWILDDVTNAPKESMLEKWYGRQGESVDPADIPARKRKGETRFSRSRRKARATR